jgi:hypothetical protein
MTRKVVILIMRVVKRAISFHMQRPLYGDTM